MATRKKQLYLGVMLLGGAALFVDRFLLPSSATAPAPVAATPTRAGRSLRPATADAPGKDPAVELSVPELPFPRNLPPWDHSGPMRDLFSPLTAGVQTTADNPDAASGQGTCAAFSREHRLEAVFVESGATGNGAAEGLRIAVIDGRWVRVGETLDGCTLIEADGNKVRFRCRDGELSLRLAAAPPR